MSHTMYAICTVSPIYLFLVSVGLRQVSVSLGTAPLASQWMPPSTAMPTKSPRTANRSMNQVSVSIWRVENIWFQITWPLLIITVCWFKSGVKKYDMFLDNYSIPLKDSVFVCRIFDLPTQMDYHVIASKPINHQSKHVGQVAVYGCSKCLFD